MSKTFRRPKTSFPHCGAKVSNKKSVQDKDNHAEGRGSYQIIGEVTKGNWDDITEGPKAGRAQRTADKKRLHRELGEYREEKAGEENE